MSLGQSAGALGGSMMTLHCAKSILNKPRKKKRTKKNGSRN